MKTEYYDILIAGAEELWNKIIEPSSIGISREIAEALQSEDLIACAGNYICLTDKGMEFINQHREKISHDYNVNRLRGRKFAIHCEDKAQWDKASEILGYTWPIRGWGYAGSDCMSTESGTCCYRKWYEDNGFRIIPAVDFIAANTKGAFTMPIRWSDPSQPFSFEETGKAHYIKQGHAYLIGSMRLENTDEEEWKRSKYRLQRIVNCLNAMDGIENPAEFVKQTFDTIKRQSRLIAMKPIHPELTEHSIEDTIVVDMRKRNPIQTLTISGHVGTKNVDGEYIKLNSLHDFSAWLIEYCAHVGNGKWVINYDYTQTSYTMEQLAGVYKAATKQ